MFFLPTGRRHRKGGWNVTELIRMVRWAGRMYLFCSINSTMSSGLCNDLMF